MRPEDIPQSVHLVAVALQQRWEAEVVAAHGGTPTSWDDISEDDRENWRGWARTALTAAQGGEDG